MLSLEEHASGKPAWKAPFNCIVFTAFSQVLIIILSHPPNNRCIWMFAEAFATCITVRLGLGRKSRMSKWRATLMTAAIVAEIWALNAVYNYNLSSDGFEEFEGDHNSVHPSKNIFDKGDLDLMFRRIVFEAPPDASNGIDAGLGAASRAAAMPKYVNALIDKLRRPI